MALLILALLQRIFLMSSLMLLLVGWYFFRVWKKLLPFLEQIQVKRLRLMYLVLFVVVDVVLVWLIFFMVLIKLLPILGTISGKTVKLMVLALICLGNNRQD